MRFLIKFSLGCIFLTSIVSCKKETSWDIDAAFPIAKSHLDLRNFFGLTQSEAASLVHVQLRAWQWWESGQRKMPVGLWELFLIKTDHHPKFKLQHKSSNKNKTI